MDDAIQDFYKIIPERFLPKYHNPSFADHGIKLPFRMLIVGGSGSGKTNLVLEIISRMDSTFDRIVLCVKNRDEPLYNFLLEQLPPNVFSIYEGIDEVPPVESFIATKGSTPLQILAIFDDLVTEKHQEVISEYFIRGRKISGGISSIYLSQSYFQTPKLIRLQCDYILLKKLASERDLGMILSDYSLGGTKAEILRLYRYATEDPLSFLMIDVPAESDHRFRKGFLEIVTL